MANPPDPPTTPATAQQRGNIFWNAHEHRLRAFVRIPAYILLMVLLILLFSIGGVTLLLLLTSGFSATTASPIDPTSPAVTLVSAGAALLGTTAALLLAARLIDRRVVADYGLRFSSGWWLDLGFGLALGALLMSGIFLIELGAGWLRVTGIAQAGDAGMSFAAAILGALFTFISVGIYEELFARGYLFKNLSEGFAGFGSRRAVLLAWLLSSAVFGVLHALNPNATLTSTLMLVIAGLFLGLGYLLTGELAIPIGLHITWNFFQGNVYGFPVSGLPLTTSIIAIEQGGPALWTGGAFGPEAGLLGLLAILVGCLLTVLWVRWRQGHTRLHTALSKPELRPRPPQAA